MNEPKHVDGDGIRIRFVDKWDIVPDPNPSAFSTAMCPKCGQIRSGAGSTLKESSEKAIANLAKHECVVLAGTISA